MEHYKVNFGSQLICSIVDEKLGLLGYIVIDSTIDGHSCGGLRMLPDVSVPELQGLARAMTLKYGFLGANEGGAKAGIAGDPFMPHEQKLALLRKFAQIASPLLKTRAYTPACDMGTNNEEIKYMLKSIGLRVPQSNVAATGDGELYVALSVLAGAEAAAKYMDLDLSQSTLAIEGFGKVGTSVAKVFSQKGTKVVAISTAKGAIYNLDGLDVDKLIQIKNEVGEDVVNVYRKAKTIEKSQLLSLDIDILSPCARHRSIGLENVHEIKAKIISAGANIPVTREAERVLWQKRKLCLPDFVTNCGGILGSNMQNAGLSERFIGNFILQEIGNQISEIIESSRKENIPPSVFAEAEAEKRFLRRKAASRQITIKNRLFAVGLAAHKSHLIPKCLVALYAPRYFRLKLRYGKGRKSLLEGKTEETGEIC